MSIAPDIRTVSAYPTAAIPLHIPRARMQAEFGGAVHELLETLAAQGLAPAGPLVAYHRSLPPDAFDFDVAFPVHGSVTPTGRVVASEVPAGRVAVHVHTGPYDSIAQSWMALDAWLAEHGHLPAGDFWEVYEVGPEPGRDPSAWRTVLYRRLADAT